MDADFPVADRNRLISNASKTLLELHIPAAWHIAAITGDTDYGLDVLVQLAHEGGIQHAFYIQLKGTESADFSKDRASIRHSFKRRTLNYYSNLTQDVMLAVAVVKLDDVGKVTPSDSTIFWQWMSVELESTRSSPFELDLSDAKTSTVHIPCDQLLHPRLDVLPHLQRLLEISRAGYSLEDLLQRSLSKVPESGRPALARLVEVARKHPDALVSWIQNETDFPQTTLPAIAYEIRTLIRAGNTSQAENLLESLGAVGLGSAPAQQAALLSLRGKVAMQRRNRVDALELLAAAYTTEASEEHLLALAEARFLVALDSSDAPTLRSVTESLNAANSDEGLALRVRVHISQGEFEAAENCVRRISEVKALLPRLVMLSGQRQWREVIAIAKEAVVDRPLSLADRTAVQLIAARAAWSAAIEGAVFDQATDELPLSGAIGTQLDLANEAWQLAVTCMGGLKSLGWSLNVELLAPIMCASAGALGRQREGMALLQEAAEHRPEYSELQFNLEVIAIGAGDAEVALRANQRQESTQAVLVRRTALLFQLRRFPECVAASINIARSSDAPQKHTPMALATGYAAAHRMGHLAQAQELKQRLLSNVDWEEFLVFGEFGRLGNVRTSGEEPLSILRQGLIKHPSSWLIASNLFSNLRVNDEEHAREALDLSQLLRRRALLNVDESILLIAALTTLKRWGEAAVEAQEALARFGPEENFLAMGAVAEEMLGRTGTALSMLETAMQVGTDRIAVIHNYMGLALRLGRLGSVRIALDRLLSLVADRSERFELMRLSALIYVQENRSTDAQEVAFGMGDLVDQSVEQEEGLFLNVVMAATVHGSPLDDDRRQAFARRVDAFCKTWPASKMFRRVTMPAHGINRIDDFHDLLEPLVGDSRARLQEFEQRERQVRSGEVAVPFIVRPGYALHYVSNPFDLWEIAKRSKPTDHQLHLISAISDAEPRSPNAVRDVPLLDLTALLILDSLDLFDKLFQLFERIAVPSLTVSFISQHANSVLSGGPGSGLAQSILARINRWLDHIDFPAGPKRDSLGQVSADQVLFDYLQLVKQRSWLAYCDDSIVRALITSETATVHVCATTDVLVLLDSEDSLTAIEIARALSQLVAWNVGINVAERFLIASLTDALPPTFKGDAASRVVKFQGHEPFTTLTRAIWNPEKSANELVSDMDRLLRSMLLEPESNGDSVAAVLALWFNRVRLLQQTGILAWKLICYPVVMALNQMPISSSQRAVGVLHRAVAASVSERTMSLEIEMQVAGELGTIAGSLAKRNNQIGEGLLGKLLHAMPLGTVNGDRCLDCFVRERRSISNAPDA